MKIFKYYLNNIMNHIKSYKACKIDLIPHEPEEEEEEN